MRLEQREINTAIQDASEEEHDFVEQYLTFKFVTWPGGQARTQRRCLVNRRAGVFPAGFTAMVKKAAESEGFAVEVIDRSTYITPDPKADLAWLRDYQVEVVDRVVKMKRGILWLPTGSGKTEIAIGLTRALPGRWLFLVHRKTLMHQTAKRYELRTGLKAGRFGDGLTDYDQPFTVATVQSIHKALRERTLGPAFFLADIEGVVFDECHTVASDQALSVLEKIPAGYRIGMSGTPLARGDNQSLLSVGALGPVIARIKPRVLIDAGVLAYPTITMWPLRQHSTKPTFQGVYGDCIVRSAARNNLLIDIAVRAAKPCLLFVKQINHGRVLARSLGRAGIKCEFSSGKDSQQRREAALSALERSDLDVVVCSVIFQEGIDVPSLASVVIGSGGKSVIAAIQRVGRGMRTDEGRKQTFEVHDIADSGNKWIQNHTRERMKAYKLEGYEVVTASPQRV